MYARGMERASCLSRSSKMNSYITNALSDFFFNYETPRQVLLRNRRVGVVCRLIQLGVLAYIIGWVFIYEKGYQSTDTAVGSVFTKMKGVGYTKVDGEERIWDMADYVFPEQGDSSFVVMTNYIITKGQKIGKCPELAESRHLCKSDSDCEGGIIERTGNGHMTGKCVGNITKTCEIVAWCPVEDDRVIPDPALLTSAENYTLFIKNSVTFPAYGVKRSNLVEGIDNQYIRSCKYDPKTSPLCPIFRLGDLVQLSGFNFTTIAKMGGAIGIVIDWTCNLDYDQSECKPAYSFHGLFGKSRASVGYNFRHAKHYMEDKQEKRTLLKVFGIRFDIIVRSVARKFDIIPTLIAMGSGVGIFGLATVICDLILLYLLPKRAFYNNMKFKVPETIKECDNLRLGINTFIYYIPDVYAGPQVSANIILQNKETLDEFTSEK